MPGDPDREHTPPPASDPTERSARKGEVPVKFEPGGRSKKLTKSLTAKTTKTRYRDPLRPRQPRRNARENQSRSKRGDKKSFENPLTGKTRQTKHRDPLRTLEALRKQRKEPEATVKRKSHKVFDSKDEPD